MAVSNIYREEKRQRIKNLDVDFIDSQLIENLQNQFCEANNMYLVCLGKEEGVITKAYGTKEELEYIYSIVDKTRYFGLIRRLEETTIENMVEDTLDQDYVKLCAVSIRLENKTQIIWAAIGFIEEKITEEDHVPDFIKRTTEHSFFGSLHFLEILSRQLFIIKMDEMIAQDAMAKSIASEEKMHKQLKRTEALTNIVKMLESDSGFSKIADDSIRETCVNLDISGGCILRENVNSEYLEVICTYAQGETWLLERNPKEIRKSDVPFFNGKPYIISADSMMPEEFMQFFHDVGIKAAIFQPITVNSNTIMYLCFYEIENCRIWELNDIKFMNDVKRIIQSILSKRIAKNSLASSYASLEAILENTGCGIYVIDPESKSLLYANQKFKDLFINTISSGKLKQLILSENELCKTHYFEEVFYIDENKWMDVHKTQIKWVDGREVHLCTTYDITEKKKYQKKIESQANNDFLTGLYNRMRCEQDLAQYIDTTEKLGGAGAVIYFDLDDFKHINDGLGHHYGDVLLKAISRSLRKVEGIESACYRMGGDEFIVIVSDSYYHQLERICQDITEIFTKPWFLKGADYYCTVSMGIASFPEDGTTVEELIRKADMALFDAKRKGKNRYEFYNDTNADSSYIRLDMEKNMRNATLNSCKEFEVYYQPLMKITKDGQECCGAEALVRWNSSVLGFVSPQSFIPLAEYLGLINPIGHHVLKEAAKRCKYWNDMGHPDYKINVNLSVVQLLQSDVVKKVYNVIRETGINPNNLTLEVTESLAINDMERMKRIISQIKELGVNVALDDFGTGYSSLNHIREMPIDIIKIDRCFIEHIAEDDFSDAFVKMVSELANTIGMSVCIEGVENWSQYNTVKDMKIKYVQGFLFGRPMQINEFESQFL